MSTDAHDEMIEAFQEYFKWQTRFEYGRSQSNLAGTKARKALSRIKRAALTRRAEIIDKQKARKERRGGRAGRPTEGELNARWNEENQIDTNE